MFRVVSLALLSLALITNSLRAQECDAILREGLLNRSVRQVDRAASNAGIKWACNASLSEVNNFLAQSDARGGGGSGGVSFLGFKIHGGGGGSGSSSLTQSDFSRWQQDNCSSETNDQRQSAFEFYAQQELSPQAIEAWRACKIDQNQQPLVCWVSPQGSDQIVFHYKWNGNSVDLPKIKDFTAVTGGEGISLGLAGETVLIGEATQKALRNPTASTLITLNLTLSGRYAYSCSGYVPALRQAVTISPPTSTYFLSGYLEGSWCIDGIRKTSWTRVERSNHFIERSLDAPNVGRTWNEEFVRISDSEFELVFPRGDGTGSVATRYVANNQMRIVVRGSRLVNIDGSSKDVPNKREVVMVHCGN